MTESVETKWLWTFYFSFFIDPSLRFECLRVFVNLRFVMNRNCLSHNGSSLLISNPTNCNWSQYFSWENAIGCLVHSKGFKANSLEVGEIFQLFIGSIFFASILLDLLYFFHKFLFDLRIFIYVIYTHHSCMLGSVSSCSVKIGKVIY